MTNNQDQPDMESRLSTALRNASAEVDGAIANGPGQRPTIPTEEAKARLETSERRRLRTKAEILRAWMIHLIAVRGPEPYIGPRDVWVLEQLEGHMEGVNTSNHDFANGESAR